MPTRFRSESCSQGRSTLVVTVRMKQGGERLVMALRDLKLEESESVRGCDTWKKVGCVIKLGTRKSSVVIE